ncbi:MAG: winged helix-turn-helix transcriptional regulator [Theionarchaea archaeon]|nr:winged helix-turn-helix transcriptional regulator [Theionarchaea archaeon]
MKDLQAAVFKAMGDETRLEILELLRNGKMCVCEIVPQIDASQSNISQHLRILKDTGIIELEKRGRSNYYSVINVKVFEIVDLVEQILLENLQVQMAKLES